MQQDTNLDQDSKNMIEHPTAKELMTPRIYMLPSTATFSDVLQIMFEKRISAIIIYNVTVDIEFDENNDVDVNIQVGKDAHKSRFYIISHTDVVDYLYKNQSCGEISEIYDRPVSEIMKNPIEIVSEDTPADVVIRLMFEKGYKRLLIGKNDEPTGILSTRDILQWNNLYFRPSKPIALMIMDNASSIILGKYIFTKNLKRSVDGKLIEMFGGAMNAISAIVEDIFKKSGEMRVFEKDNYSILFEPRDLVTGILICERGTIELRRRLMTFTDRFIDQYKEILEDPNYSLSKPDIDIAHLAEVFSLTKY